MLRFQVPWVIGMKCWWRRRCGQCQHRKVVSFACNINISQVLLSMLENGQGTDSSRDLDRLALAGCCFLTNGRQLEGGGPGEYWKPQNLTPTRQQYSQVILEFTFNFSTIFEFHWFLASLLVYMDSEEVVVEKPVRNGCRSGPSFNCCAA